MLSRKIPKLELYSKSKGEYSNNNYSNLAKYRFNLASLVNEYLLPGIPVLSIFALIGIGLFMTTICGMTFMDSRAYAESYTENSGSSSITLTIGGAGETEQVPAGRGATTYRSHTVRVQASNVSNYGLVITGPSNLTPPSDGTVITGISNQTGLEMDSSNAYDDTWGYGWGDTNTDNANLTYRTLSTIGTDILTVNGTNDKPVLVNRAVDFTKKLVFAVKFSEDATPGRYYANVTLSLTATPSTLTTYSITYNGNGNTGGTVPAKQSIDLYDTTSYNGFTAAANTGNLTKTGYNFLGWAESSSATAAQYAIGATIPLTQSKPEIKLYAVWEKIPPFSGITNMQQMTTTICKSAAIGDNATLTDTRDGSTYTVRKLPDSKCWMTQNLRLTGNRSLTSANSNVSNSFFLTTSSISGFSTMSSSDGYASKNYYKNNTSYGAYYNWYTATAGTGNSSKTSGEATASICPLGWRLPAQTDYITLNSSIGGAFRNSPYNFQLSGLIRESSEDSFGSIGLYWTRTVQDANFAKFVRIQPSSVNVYDYEYRYRGLSVRCVAYSS